MNDGNVVSGVGILNRQLLELGVKLSDINLAGLEFRVEMMIATVDDKHYNTGVHEHPFFELSMLRHGSMKYRVSGSSMLEIGAGDYSFICIPPHTPHSRETGAMPSLIYGFQVHINSSDNRSRRLCDDLSRTVADMGCHLSNSSLLADIWEKIITELTERTPLCFERSALLVNEFFITLLRLHFPHLLRSVESSHSEGLRDRIVVMACRYIEEHCGRQILIDDVAAHCSMSSRQLSRVFSQSKGVSLGNYIIARKVELARKKLALREPSIKELAAELGYNNPSYFCRLFKKVTGHTPESYRKNTSQVRKGTADE